MTECVNDSILILEWTITKSFSSWALQRVKRVVGDVLTHTLQTLPTSLLSSMHSDNTTTHSLRKHSHMRAFYMLAFHYRSRSWDDNNHFPSLRFICAMYCYKTLLYVSVWSSTAHAGSNSRLFWETLPCSAGHVPTHRALLSHQTSNQMFCQHANNLISTGSGAEGGQNHELYHQRSLINTNMLIARNQDCLPVDVKG